MNIKFNENNEEIIFFCAKELDEDTISFIYIKEEKKVEGFIDFIRRNTLLQILSNEDYKMNYTCDGIESINDEDCKNILKILLKKHSNIINEISN